MTTVKADASGKIECKIDGAMVHSVQVHIRDHHPEWSVERYQKEFPGEPLLSPEAERTIRENREKKARLGAPIGNRQKLSDVFGVPDRLTINKRGQPIMIRVFQTEELSEEQSSYVPDIDTKYVFDVDTLKVGIMAMELNKTALTWGFHGTGKTTLWEQIAARTKRPFMRIQHTINTEESHILGQWMVRDGETVYNLGPLPNAMKHGMVYCADEYDFAMPSVTSVYQPVLEGKPLVIKDAPPELRVIRPHPDFRFVATGNTNGGGDETGLYQGTNIQNAANYSRFGITIEIKYPDPKVETAIIASQSGCRLEEAAKLVDFAKEMRQAFGAGRITNTVSPRELINAAELALVKGSDWRGGLQLALLNRMSRADREACDQWAQRIFGAAA